MIGMSETVQLFTWEGSLCWVSCMIVGGDKAMAIEAPPYEVRITRIGRSHASLERLLTMLTENSQKRKPSREKLIGATWMCQGSLINRPLETVVSNDDVAQKVIDAIEKFRESEGWYVRHGFPYKLCICLYGPPGTGKNSVVRAAAYATQCSIHSINSRTSRDSEVAIALAELRDRTKRIILFDDFDSDAFLARNLDSCKAGEYGLGSKPIDPNGEDSGEELQHNPQQQQQQPRTGMTLQGFLSTLDGEDTPHGSIFILTTNDFSHLDPAIVRDGRISHKFYLGPLEDPAIRKYIAYMYEETEERVNEVAGAEPFKPIVGASLESVYKASKSMVEMVDKLRDKQRTYQELQ